MIAALVLAAGVGRRFGGPKQLTKVEGRPLLEHALGTACAVEEIDDVVVVLGARASEIGSSVSLGRARLVVCADWERGISASLRCGLSAIPSADVAVITLGDQPGITVEAVQSVLRGVQSGDVAARATYGGNPGHPVVVRSTLFGPMRRLSGDRGANALLRSIGVREVDCSGIADPLDVDRRADALALNQAPTRAGPGLGCGRLVVGTQAAGRRLWAHR